MEGEGFEEMVFRGGKRCLPRWEEEVVASGKRWFSQVGKVRLEEEVFLG